MRKNDNILEGMKTYFESKEPAEDMKELLKHHAAGSMKEGRRKWELENPTEKTMAHIMSRERV